MKQKKRLNRLSLNKNTVASLNIGQMLNVFGGDDSKACLQQAGETDAKECNDIPDSTATFYFSCNPEHVCYANGVNHD